MGDVISDDYQTDYVAGQDNIEKFGFDIHNIVFPLTAILIVAFVVGTLIFPAGAKELLDSAKNGAIAVFDWGFLLSANLFVVFCLALIFMPVGKIRIGGLDAKPEFSLLSWFAMLFAAGMGTGLMFWSVAEPVAYYTDWYGTPWVLSQTLLRVPGLRWAQRCTTGVCIHGQSTRLSGSRCRFLPLIKACR